MSSNNLEPHLQTGVGEIDQEHALELQIVRAIQSALTGSDRTRVEALVQQLEDFTNAHFLAEQMLMRLHAYPGYEAHQQEHDQLMAELKEISRKLLTDDLENPSQEAENLERWLIVHIQSEDQALAEYLKQQGVES